MKKYIILVCTVCSLLLCLTGCNTQSENEIAALKAEVADLKQELSALKNDVSSTASDDGDSESVQDKLNTLRQQIEEQQNLISQLESDTETMEEFLKENGLSLPGEIIFIEPPSEETTPNPEGVLDTID